MPSKRCVWAILPVLILAACGGSASAPSASPSASAPATSPAASKPAPAAATAPGGATKPVASAPAKLTPVKSAFVSIGAHTLPIWLAADRGLFQQQGISVDVAYVEGSVTAIPAMAAGDLQIIEATPAASVQAQLKGTDNVVLATHIPFADYRLMVAPEIKTIDDLRGKTIGQVKAGTVDDEVVRFALKKRSLNPDKDVKITYLNTQPAILAALQQKLIQGTAQSTPNDFAAERNGAHELINIFEDHYPYPVDGIIATRKFVREHPAETDAFLKAYIQGIRYIKANPDDTKKVLQARTKIDDPQVIDAGYKVMTEVVADNPVPLPDDIATVLPLFDGAGKNPADFVDPAPLAKAMQELGAAPKSS